MKPVKDLLDMRWDKVGASTVVRLMKAVALAGMKKNKTLTFLLNTSMPIIRSHLLLVFYGILTTNSRLPGL